MRSIVVFTAPWYPGHAALLDAVEASNEKLEGKDVEITVMDVESELKAAEEHHIVTVPTAVLFKGEKERRRIAGAVGMVELLGLAGVRSRARKPQKK